MRMQHAHHCTPEIGRESLFLASPARLAVTRPAARLCVIARRRGEKASSTGMRLMA